MTVRDILYYPEHKETLTTECEAVDEVNEDIRELVDDLVETMSDANGVGLAAPQIGELKRITVIDVSEQQPSHPDPFVLINPEIADKSGELKWEEGCLSFPGLYREVERASQVTVEATNRDGERYTVEGEGLLSVALQHEIDHLDGVLFIDHLSLLKRRMAMKEYRKIRNKMEAEETGS